MSLLPYIALLYNVVLRVVAHLFGAHPSEPNPVFGFLAQIPNPILDLAAYFPICSFLMTIIAYCAFKTGSPWFLTNAIFFPLLTSLAAIPACMFATIDYPGIVTNEGGVGDTIVFGENMGQTYHSLLVSGWMMFFYFPSSVLFYPLLLIFTVMYGL